MDASSAISAHQEARPPATDPFTYLTLIETHLSPEILPELDHILQDAELTQTIGWDLVDKLVKLPGCETCLETIARLGNPREVIIKVNEALSQLDVDEGYEADEEDQKLTATDDVSYTHNFLSPLNMRGLGLAISTVGIAACTMLFCLSATAMLFAHEAIGGVVFGGLIGYLVYLMIKSIEQYQIEVMLTLALVIGGSAMASELHVSAPIAMVVAG